jgi:hypothetical protein
VAWHYDKSSIFTVRSAYRLAFNIKNGVRWRAGNSENHTNSRDSWNIIWKASIPKKVKIFGWRVANDNLATKRNKMKRTLEADSICNICGRVEEDSHHATICCTKSRALRYEMRKHWDIPNESVFSFTGKDWLQNLMYKLNKKQRSQILMLLWRSWHLRNDAVHEKGEETVARSVTFLLGYDKVLNEENNNQNIKAHLDLSKPVTDVSCSSELFCRATKKDTPSWIPPDRDKLKMNVDAGFIPSTGEATAGFAVQNHLGSLVLAGSTSLQTCKNAEEAEALAVWTGLNTAYQLNLKLFALESDNAAVICALECSSVNTSSIWHIYRNINALSWFFPNLSFGKVNRCCNILAHELAQRAKVHRSTHAWHTHFPADILEICNRDSVNMMVD